MRSSIVRLAAEATHSRTPMIHFLGKRANLEYSQSSHLASLSRPYFHSPYHPLLNSLMLCLSSPAEPHAPSPHPAAPQDIVDNFQSFLSKFQSTSTSADSPSSNPKGQSLDSSAKGQVRDHPSKDASPSASSSSSSSSTTQVVNKGSGKPSDFDTYFMAPTKFWRPKMFSPEELEAVQVSPCRPPYSPRPRFCARH
jgi:small subunit ribosomal protein YMR-31